MYPVPSGGNIINGFPVGALTIPPGFGPLGEQRDGGGKVQLKRRRRCGQCGPCLVKENCNQCQFCLRKEVLKQACVRRKCVRLRKQGSRLPQETTDGELVRSNVNGRESNATSPRTNSYSSNVSPASIPQSSSTPIPGDYDSKPSPVPQPVSFPAMPAVTGVPSLQALADQGKQDLLGHPAHKVSVEQHSIPPLSGNTSVMDSSLAGDPRKMNIGNGCEPNMGQNLIMSSPVHNPNASTSSGLVPFSDSVHNSVISSFTQIPYISDSAQNSFPTTSRSAQNLTNSSTTSAVNFGVSDSFPPRHHFQSVMDQWAGMPYGFTHQIPWSHPSIHVQPNPSAFYGRYPGGPNHFDYSNRFGSSQFGVSDSAGQLAAPSQSSFTNGLPFSPATLTSHGGYGLSDYQHSAMARALYQSPANSSDSRTNYPVYGYPQLSSANVRQPMPYSGSTPNPMYNSGLYCPVSTPSEPHVYHVRGPSVCRPFRNASRDSPFFPYDLLWDKVKNLKKKDMECLAEKCTVSALEQSVKKGLYGALVPAHCTKCSATTTEKLIVKQNLGKVSHDIDRCFRTEYLLQLIKEFCVQMKKECDVYERPRQVGCAHISGGQSGTYRCRDFAATLSCCVRSCTLGETGQLHSCGAGEKISCQGPNQNVCDECVAGCGSVREQTSPARCLKHNTGGSGCEELSQHIYGGNDINVNIATNMGSMTLTVYFWRDDDNTIYFVMAATVSYTQLHINSQGCEMFFVPNWHSSWESMRMLGFPVELSICVSVVLILILLTVPV